MARKYRPRSFTDLVGQGQVTRTLTQALKTGRVAHAYLFTGPRGVGKTTAARLLAAALSCESEGDRPCGACDRCLEIQSGRSVDVIEMDAASNRGIDEIRGLRETVKFQPARNRFKVYIIDEVHALTGDAFNALLKTLEEPPSHVVFVFATTDAHKVPATIVSRCQRYDFRRIKVEDIAGRLKSVAEAEGLPYEPEALVAMARQAEGGLRDALGLADQVAASDGELTLAAVTRSLGLVQRDLVARVALSPLRGDAASALLALRDAYETGSDFKELGLKILEYVRDLTLVKASPKASEMMDLTDAEERDFKEAAKPFTLQDIHRHFEAWLRIYSDLARHPQPRWLMESHIIRLSQAGCLDGLAELTARLTALLESEPSLLRDAIRNSTLSGGQMPGGSGGQTPGYTGGQVPGGPPHAGAGGGQGFGRPPLTPQPSRSGPQGTPGAPGTVAPLQKPAGQAGAQSVQGPAPGRGPDLAQGAPARPAPSGFPPNLSDELYLDALDEIYRDDDPDADLMGGPRGVPAPRNAGGRQAVAPAVATPPSPATPAPEAALGTAGQGPVRPPAAAPASHGHGTPVSEPDEGRQSPSGPLGAVPQGLSAPPGPGQEDRPGFQGSAQPGYSGPVSPGQQGPAGNLAPAPQGPGSQGPGGSQGAAYGATFNPSAFIDREEIKVVLERVKAMPEAEELMRRTPGSFVGFKHTYAVPAAGQNAGSDDWDSFSDEDEDRFADDSDLDASADSYDEDQEDGFSGDSPDDEYPDD
jgi:DNA polymerase-3 subunit gamma/tau